MFTEQQCQKKNPNSARKDTTMISEVIHWEGLKAVLMCPKAISSVSLLSLWQVMENATQVKPSGETDALSECSYSF